MYKFIYFLNHFLSY